VLCAYKMIIEHFGCNSQILKCFKWGCLYMNTNDLLGSELLTAEDAAEMLSMSVNAFRIFVHRYGSKVKKVKLGKRKTFYYRSSILALLQEC
jgi:hypothetical protein